MTDVATDRPEFELSSPASRGTVGEQLRAARISQGMSVDAVAKQLKLAARQVTALESDDLASLPEGPFVRGFVRNYARLVGLVPEQLVHESENRKQVLSPLQGISEPKGELRNGSSTGRGRRAWWLIPAALGAAVLCASIWFEYSRRPKSSAENVTAAPIVVVPAATSPVPTAPPTSAPIAPAVVATQAPASPPDATATVALPPVVIQPTLAPASPPTPTPDDAMAKFSPNAASAAAQSDKPIALVLSFAAASWTEVRDGSGAPLTSKLHPAGTSISITGKPPFRFIVGKASKVTLTRNGERVDLESRIDANDLAKFTLE